jgi:hypothetical protein
LSNRLLLELLLILHRFRQILAPYGIVLPRIDHSSQLWNSFHSGYSVVCVVHNYRLAVAAEGKKQQGNVRQTVFKVPGLDKVDRSNWNHCAAHNDE